MRVLLLIIILVHVNSIGSLTTNPCLRLKIPCLRFNHTSRLVIIDLNTYIVEDPLRDEVGFPRRHIIYAYELIPAMHEIAKRSSYKQHELH